MVWAIYDKISMKIESITWEEPIDENSIEIESALAEDLMTGAESIHKWKVRKNKNSLFLEKEKDEEMVEPIPIIWNSMNEDFQLIVEESSIKIMVRNDDPLPIILYATLKNDPSWLVKTWNLYDRKNYKGIISIDFKNAKNHSYYTDKI